MRTLQNVLFKQALKYNTISLKIRIASGAGEVCSNTENEEKCLTKMAKNSIVTAKCNEKSRSVRRIVPS